MIFDNFQFLALRSLFLPQRECAYVYNFNIRTQYSHIAIIQDGMIQIYKWQVQNLQE
jgi:hypothetical protein